jgi:diguanylate cyclase (GGDEF)-like protein
MRVTGHTSENVERSGVQADPTDGRFITVDWVRYQLGPRDERTAARTATWIFLVSTVVVTISNVLAPLERSDLVWSTILTVPLVAFGALLAWPAFRYKPALLLVTPLIGVFFIVSLDLSTHDASAGAQVAFCLPVLFASSQLRLLGAVVAAVASITGDAIIVSQLRPSVPGVIDVVNLALVLSLMTGLLVFAGRRQDRLVAMLERQASHDALTGLVTRRVLDEAMERALTMPVVHAGTALILVDVDHFKSINDSYGHPVGDDALKHVAEVLGRHSRPNTVISRLGGDEIAVLLPGCSELVARERAQEFLRTMRESPLLLPGGNLLAVSISLGVAHAPSGESALRELYAAADASLYEAKRGGRGRVGRATVGHPLFESPPQTDASDGLSEGLTDGLLEVRDMLDGVAEGDLGLPGDDRIDHR